jgi:hypothetical protein
MNSLKEVFTAMQGHDHEKVAQARAVAQHGPSFANVDAELLKQAQDYDHVGRVLAHHVFADLIKQAMDEEMPDASEEEKKTGLEALMASARGEKKGDDDEDEDEKSEAAGEKDDEKEDDAEEEKKASVRAAIIHRMARDPEYVSQLIAKHTQR